jgi:hypothetical protein
MAGVVVPVAALAELLPSRRSAWEGVSSATLFADKSAGPR